MATIGFWVSVMGFSGERPRNQNVGCLSGAGESILNISNKSLVFSVCEGFVHKSPFFSNNFK